MSKIAVIAAVLTMSGCATCQEHPSLCAAGVTILATSLALSVQGPDKPPGGQSPKTNIGNPSCSSNPAQCK